MFYGVDCGAGQYRVRNECFSPASKKGIAYQASKSVRDFIKKNHITSVSELASRMLDGFSRSPDGVDSQLLVWAITFNDDLGVHGDAIVWKASEETELIVASVFLIASAVILVAKAVTVII
jgi:hypothetical protein